mmetsp:Transcript_176/g.565  ORF Transcript_176/g.565 Transcript_176/m.565 type:complete len:161 (-) Transcript_176:357-839(-)
MAGDWNKLGAHYASADNVLIVDVDCTADGQQTCQSQGVQGYPTIKYYTDKTGKKGAAYQGGRDFNSLKQFAESTLNKGCNALTGVGCAANEKTFIDKMKAKSAEEFAEEMKTKTTELAALKKEKSAAEAEWKEKEKGFKRKERNLNKALGILKQLEKTKK